MTSDWKVRTLAEAGVVLLDCVHKTPQEDSDSDYRYVAIPQMSSGRLRLEEAKRISQSDFNIWTRKANPKAHDVVLSRRCNPGETAYVTPGEQFALGQNLVLLRADGNSVFPPFLRWLVRGPAWWEQIQKNLNVGAVFDSLKCKDVPLFELPIPPLDEQRAIARVLGALDDKIEQNRRTAWVLERLARAIFRAWFVDFEPVKAKAAGATAFPSMPQEVFDTLPTRLIDSEIGPVPEGWEVKALGDIAAQVRLPAKPDEIDPETPYIGLEHMPRRSFTLSEWEAVSKVTSSKSRFKKGQFLFGKLRPYFHKVGVAQIDGVSSTDIVVIEPKRVSLYGQVLGLISSDAFVGHATACSSGTKMPRTNWKDMARYRVAIGPGEVASAHTNLLKAIIDKVIADAQESRKLAEMRDYLLPKFFSGEVRVQHSAVVLPGGV